MTAQAHFESTTALDERALDQVSGGMVWNQPKPPPKDELPQIPNDPPKKPLPFPPTRPTPIPTEPLPPEPRLRWWR